jgi:CPA2 family monovalent cation:H+ antiporter-2
LATTGAPIAEYSETLLFLATAGVVAPLLRRLRVNSVLGFIFAGVILGPYVLGALAVQGWWPRWLSLSKYSDISHLAEFGVVFLLFMIGLELSFERLSRMKRLVFGLGAVQVIGSAALIGFAAWIAGVGPGAAAVIGGALALSSTAIVIPVLAEKRRLGSTAGRVTFSVLLFQDLAVAPLLVMVSMLSRGDGGAFNIGALGALAPAALAMAALVFVGRIALRPLFHLVAAAGTTEFFVAACLFVVMAASIAASLAGLSMGLGAFVAGLLLAETEFRREIEVTIEPFKGLLLGLYFLTMGAGLDLSKLFLSPGSVLALALGLIIGKAALFYLAARAFGVAKSAARESALMLGPGGEFAFVMIGAATAGGVMSFALSAQLTISVALSMLAIPGLALIARRLAPAPPQPGLPSPGDSADAAPIDSAGRVIVIGYGRVGRVVADLLRAHSIPVLIIDEDARIAAAARREGVPVIWGNAARAEFLRRCDLPHARALVVTINAPRRVEEIVAIARGERADLTIVARARDAVHATHLYGLGATDAVPENLEASLQLSEALLVDIGVPMGYVIASIHEKRDEFRKMLQPVADPERAARVMRRPDPTGSARARLRGKEKPQEGRSADAAPSPTPPPG